MYEKYKIILLVSIAGVLLGGAAFGAGSDKKVVVREGSAIDRMGGELRMVKAENGGDFMQFEGADVWLFKLGEDVNDFRNVLEAGAELQLLPSSALEKLIDDLEKHPGSRYRLSGRITKYKGVNYIFADYFVPVVEIGAVEFDEPNDVGEPNEAVTEPIDANSVAGPNDVNEVEKPVKPVRPARRKIEVSELLTDPNGVLEVPQEVLDKLNSEKILVPRKMEPRVKEAPRKFEPREVVLPEKKIKDQVKPEETPEPNSVSVKKGGKGADSAVSEKAKVEGEKKDEAMKRPAMKLDSVLVDRIARLVKQEDGPPVFVLDAMGLGGPEGALEALPCEVLEMTELRIGAALNPMRFKIAGIRTKFRGAEYLLLQKATRVYGHGNFGN